ncbi:MAG: hypothetical protein K5682_08245 [Lachnospiraceae bacterium]|nr:hypothetical protein [Lachnospiraceae bacterium]
MNKKEQSLFATLKPHMLLGILLLLYSVVTLFLFHRQTVGYDGRYISDMPSYVAEVQGINSGFSFPYPIYFWAGKVFRLFTTPEHAVALATLVLNDLGLLVTYLVLCKLMKQCNRREENAEGNVEGINLFWQNILPALLSVSLMLVSMVYPMSSAYLSGEAHRYLGVFTPNPYHNGTYLAARGFMLLAFFSFATLLEEGYSLKKGLLFSLWLLFATMTKPSFTLIFGAAALVILLVRLVSAGGKNLKEILLLGVLFIPTILDLIYQYAGVFLFGNSGEAGAESLGVGFGMAAVWGSLTDNIPVAVFRGIFFPLMIAILYSDAFKITWYRLSWEVYVAGLLSALFLYEKGYRMMHMNFAWGYMAGMFLVFLTGTMVLMQRTIASRKRLEVRPMLGWLTFFCHLICGIIYFGYLLNGGLFH